MNRRCAEGAPYFSQQRRHFFTTADHRVWWLRRYRDRKRTTNFMFGFHAAVQGDNQESARSRRTMGVGVSIFWLYSSVPQARSNVVGVALISSTEQVLSGTR